MRVRPSSASLAELCLRSAWLGQKHHESQTFTREGSAHDREITKAIVTNDASYLKSQQAEHLWAWYEANLRGKGPVRAQAPCRLVDPETGETLSEGTADLVVRELLGPEEEAERVTVVDWKKADQWRWGLMPDLEDNLQLLIYLAAVMLATGARTGRIIVVPFDADGVYPEESREYSQVDMWDVIDRVRSIPPIPKKEPEAKMGPHCTRCWQRRHCSAYILPRGEEMPGALVPLATAEAMTHVQALEAARWLEAAKLAVKRGKELVEKVEEAVEAHVLAYGAIIDEGNGRTYDGARTAGRRSGPSLEELEASGLGYLIKRGKPSVTYKWRKLPKDYLPT